MKWTAAACAAIVFLIVAGCSRPAADARETAPAPSSSTAPAAGTSARPRIVVLGDSLTAGYGLDLSQSVPSLLQDQLTSEGYPYEVVNAGVSGDTSAGGLSRLDWSLDGDVRVLILELGANDGLRGLPVAALKQNLETIIARAKARGIQVVLTGMEAPPNYGPAYTAAFRQVYRDLARTHRDIVYVPFYLEGVAGDPSLNISDGIHPNPQGARIIERNIWHALEPLLQKDRG